MTAALPLAQRSTRAPSVFWRCVARALIALCYLVHSGAQCTTMATLPPPSNPVRLTITVTPEVHETFKRMASAGSMSISRAMGDWLNDTLEAAEFMTSMIERARESPRLVVQELRANALGAADEAVSLLDEIRQKAAAARPGGRGRPAGRAAAAPPPRPVIRGGKSPTSRKAPK